MTLLKEISSKMPIAFGGAAISGEGKGYGFGDISEEASIELLKYSYEKGIRIYDTAPIYGFGLSEQRIGKAFRQNRDQVFIVSKSGVDWDQNKRVNMTNDPKVAERMLEQSLRDLKTDYIDLYMIHWPDQNVDIRKPLEIFRVAKEKKKIRHIGLCNTTLEDLNKAKEVVDVEVVQSELNYFERRSAELFPYLREHNISFMSWGTFDKGILTGRVDEKRKFDSSDARSWAPWWKATQKDEKYTEVRRLKAELENKGKTLTQFALEFNLSYPEVTTLICGYRSKEQLDDVLRSLPSHG